MNTPAEQDFEKAFARTPWREFLKFCHEYKEVIERMIFWAWTMRRNYDWDGHCVYIMLYLKLDRMYKCFRDSGNCCWTRDENNKLMRKLNLARNLTKRLAEDNYNTQADEVEKIWGKLQMSFTPYTFPNGQKGSTCNFYFDNTKEADQPKARKAMDEARKLDEAQKVSERTELFKILTEELDKFWD
jgi:hypothetical protein